jgi:hypothetical protein
MFLRFSVQIIWSGAIGDYGAIHYGEYDASGFQPLYYEDMRFRAREKSGWH